LDSNRRISYDTSVVEYTMSVVTIDTLTRRFGNVTAVNDLSLTVDEGEIFGFLGPNGAGKSTTINILLGFLNSSSGSATIFGHDVTAESRAIRNQTGLLPEGYDVYENLTGREHIISAIETKQASDDPDAIIERVGLDPDDARRAAGEYSMGMTQRMALGIALVGDPNLLILDEPSSGLDPNGVRLLRQIVSEEAEHGTTVFFSSHVLDEVERVCDRVGIMRDGTLVAVNSVDKLRSELEVGSIVEVTVDRLPNDFSEHSMKNIEGVAEVTAGRTVVRVQCMRPTAKMQVLRRIDDVATITDIAIEEGSLETVFGAYTGNPTNKVPANDVSATKEENTAESAVSDIGGE
jgi:ABC-2 type transport system ATP-binding protein